MSEVKEKKVRKSKAPQPFQILKKLDETEAVANLAEGREVWGVVELPDGVPEIVDTVGALAMLKNHMPDGRYAVTRVCAIKTKRPIVVVPTSELVD